MLRKNDKGVAVRRLQEQLLLLGYALTRFGADGALGDETLFAVEQFKRDRGLGTMPDDLPNTISDGIIREIAAAAAAKIAVPPPSKYLNAIDGHPHAARSVSKPFRTWREVAGVTLHQTAGLYGEAVTPWQTVHAHFGITRKGQVIQMYELTEVVNHGHGLNATDVGIEIDGWFEGIEGNFSTLWQPPNGPRRQPLQPTPEQIDSTRNLVTWIAALVSANGGALKYVHAHRQASNQRQSDPGSRVWKDVGIWAQTLLALKDGGLVAGRFVGGDAYKVGTGLKIPRDWDPRYASNAY